ncbi:MAG: bifunctional 4-hydroxy-2-oxoglutarate aldolase/2-dehydro-3-deoxy-phosphogluconate aldolase [Clostridia bacterium]|nr:bifunctional 4-hydroxy-2-oxoglutarate aldolase/2-dehydro-3-deoxy-phosphogluconate aldolase [Clostridia bacterium]
MADLKHFEFDKYPVIPVVTINDAPRAVPLAFALLAAGIGAMEITLRTPAGIDAVKAAAEGAPEMLVGAGSVLGAEDAERALKAGANFIVSPGFDAGVLSVCRERGVPYIPGCATATEIQAAVNCGCTLVKFFPAEALGGVNTLRALAAPFPGLRFMPTGGINARNAAGYLRLGCVACVGTSSIASAADIDAGNYELITRNAILIQGSDPCSKKSGPDNGTDGAGATRSPVKNGRRRIAALGELMLRLSPPEKLRFRQAHSFEACFGGAEANVALSLACLGEKVRFITALPENELGDAAVDALRRFGADEPNGSGILRTPGRMGVYFLEKGAGLRPPKVIYDRAGSAFALTGPEQYDLDKLLDDAGWLHITGITPALSDNTAELSHRALRTAQEKGLTVSMDLNYRKKLWDADNAARTLTALLPYVDLLIANEEHAAKICGIRCDDDPGETARQLCEKYGFTAAAITRRRTVSADLHRISAAAFIDGVKAYSPEFACGIVDRTGGGDAFAAGLIYARVNGFPAQDAVNFAAAAAALKHTVEGDFSLMRRDEIEALLQNCQGK